MINLIICILTIAAMCVASAVWCFAQVLSITEEITDDDRP